MMAVDFVVLSLGCWVAVWLALPHGPINSSGWWLLSMLAPVVAIPIFSRMGLYRAVIRYLGEQALKTVVKAVLLATLLWTAIALVLAQAQVAEFSFRVTLIYWLFATLTVVSTRMLVKEWLWRPLRSQFRGNNVLVYGAGDAGVQLANALMHSRELYPVAFLDDDARLYHREVAGLRVYPLSQLEHIIPLFGIKEVLLALPGATRARRHEIIRALERHPVHARVLPSFAEIAQGRVEVSDLREVEIEDLLGRDSVPPDLALLQQNVTRRSVLVTGAGGSIGSELCRQIVRLKPARLILLELSEHSLYQIDRELKRLAGYDAVDVIVPILGSVLNGRLLDSIIDRYSIDTIYHAAAYKHVPLMETNEIEGVRNNVFGTLAVAEAAMRKRISTMVLISTDKAVRPTNVMGASKRLAELILQALHQKVAMARTADGDTVPVFSMVRFGNVLGSSGSVIPLFREQIAAGGPVTVTHPKVTRYFMSIPESAQLVIQAGAMAQGGDVFVLDMGKPVRILDLARQMIHLSGLEVLDESTQQGDIAIEFSGLRPGEKLYEELLIGDNPIGTEHSKIMRAKEELLPWTKLEQLLAELGLAIDSLDTDTVRNLVLTTAKGRAPDRMLVAGGQKVVDITAKR